MSWERTLDHYGALIEERLKGYLAEAVKEAMDYVLLQLLKSQKRKQT
jgi:hypothetical protein